MKLKTFVALNDEEANRISTGMIGGCGLLQTIKFLRNLFLLQTAHTPFHHFRTFLLNHFYNLLVIFNSSFGACKWINLIE